MRLWLPLLGLLLGLAPPTGAVELRYKLKSGEKLTYRDQLAIAFRSQGGKGGDGERWQFRSDSRLVQTVRHADGSITVEIQTTDNKSEYTSGEGESHKSESKPPAERIRMTPRGQVLERKTLGEKASEDNHGYTTTLDELAIIQQVFDGQTFPEKDVSPGDEWTDTLPVDLTPDSKSVRTMVDVPLKTTFKRLVKIHGEECAELVSDFTVPLRTPKDKESEELNLSIDGRILGHLTTYFSVTRGRSLVELATLGAVGKMTLSPAGGDKAEVGGVMKINIKTVLEE